MADIKRDLRRKMRRLRDSLSPAERESASRAIMKNVLRTVKTGSCVMAYIAIGSEVRTDELIVALHGVGCRVCLPQSMGQGRMRAVEYRPGDALLPDVAGVPAPSNSREIAPEEISIVLVPGIAFDMTGRRLGYGGGYYDRFLTGTGAVRIGLAYAAQILPELPAEAWDEPVDAIADENALHEITRETVRGSFRPIQVNF